MEDDCEEIFTSSLLKKYTQRPQRLEHVTLADFAAWYKISYKPYVKKTFEVDVDNLPLEISNDDQNDDEEGTFDTCNSNAQKYKMRAKARIIRSVCFNQQIDPEKHYRELIMLFTSIQGSKLTTNWSHMRLDFWLCASKFTCGQLWSTATAYSPDYTNVKFKHYLDMIQTGTK